MNDQMTSTLISQRTKDTLKKIAHKMDVSVSAVIRLAIKEFIENEKKREAKKK